MSDEPKKPPWTWTWAWLIVLVLLAYLASESPAAMIAVRVYRSSGSTMLLHAINHVYAPLDWVRRLR
ncbi:MAG TPA: hypothetical protein VGP76_20655 [Planctomycetaceae bacterium]|jgi:hypothetical protein|nr:hypothetical protein [Planctomycetaceae bacterium]